MAKKVLVSCNTLTSIEMEHHIDACVLHYRLGKDFPDIDFYQHNARRLSIDRFRNQAATFAMQLEADYIFFIDDDMRFQDPRTLFKQLLDASEEYDIVAALNYIRGYPFDVMGFQWKDPEKKDHLRFVTDEEVEAAGGKVIKVEAIGTAVSLIKLERIKNVVPLPWFVTGPRNTEDIYFCMKSQDYFPEVKIGLHCGAITGHLLDREVISMHTKKALIAYHRSFMSPDELEAEKEHAIGGDRGVSYIKENIEESLEDDTRS